MMTGFARVSLEDVDGCILKSGTTRSMSLINKIGDPSDTNLEVIVRSLSQTRLPLSIRPVTQTLEAILRNLVRVFSMLSAFIKGVSQLDDKATRNTVLISAAFAILVFGILWFAIGYLLIDQAVIEIGWLDTLIDILGGLATVLLTWFLFPGVVSATVGLFLERVCEAVEARHYPNLPTVTEPPVAMSIGLSLKFLAVMVLLNIFLLVFLFVPPVFPFVFYAVNGYLLSREYFELVAHRRLPPAEARALRKAHQGQLFVAGVLIAVLLTVPVVNLLAPVIATASMVHLFESWRVEVRPV